ncbi:TetR family transcriptional regulator [Geodermatophilus nigrescens]|uniref:Transcriptional regulator, TetR family n=1 Tax=Geodermatophilus nigrescens TaxID=1070870 RepID=A0A1M5I6L4_9ACTN|nr:TetR family transcriptional regulator [Geodermatophilus nigrescens]SHG23689.1 transcriptional regulator, TetR family [Geodermatophilus nigrescens]
MGSSRATAGERGGRPPVSSAHEVAAVAQRIFVERGFDATSVDDVAAAAGISRRTFFRYFPTKADVLFVDSPREVERFRAGLAAGRTGESWRARVVRAVVEALEFPPEERSWAFHRAQVFFAVPAVQAHAVRVWAAWRQLAVEHARTVPHADPLFPLAVGHAVLAATLAAHEHWTRHPGEELGVLLARMLDLLLPPDGAAG